MRLIEQIKRIIDKIMTIITTGKFDYELALLKENDHSKKTFESNEDETEINFSS